MSQVKGVPNEKQPMCPYIIVRDANKAIAFYQQAFGATLLFALKESSGKVGHAELEMGGGHFMLADEYPDFGALGPVSIGGTAVSIHLYVPAVDETVARAVKAGATLLRPVKDEFYGDRVGLLSCPFGHKWFLATRQEDVSPAEMQKRMDAAYE